MAKINLLTIHWGNCFGAVMQTYATCKILENFGHEVCVINLVPRSALSRFKEMRPYFNLARIRDIKFLAFKHRYFPKMTRLCFSLDNKRMPSCDYTIVGSDQVWRPYITKNLWKHFFLDFAEGSKKISLSSSFGLSHFEGDKITAKELLGKFDAISVREDSGVQILSNDFKLPSVQLVDPTIACEDYGRFIKNIKPSNDYVYPYLLISGDKEKQIVNYVCKELCLPELEYNSFQYKLKSGPVDRLNDIYNASFVIVSSFHGLVFSLLFKKNFIVLCANKEAFTRLYSLLQLLHLENRYVESIEEISNRRLLVTGIDYSIVEPILQTERMRFYAFVDNNIV